MLLEQEIAAFVGEYVAWLDEVGTSKSLDQTMLLGNDLRVICINDSHDLIQFLPLSLDYEQLLT